MSTLRTPKAATRATPSEPPKTGIERRRSTREPVLTPGTLRALAADGSSDPLDPGQQVLVTNVSLHGAGFRSHQPLTVENRYTIEIGVGPLHLTSRLRIVRVRQLPDGTFDIGGEFI